MGRSVIEIQGLRDRDNKFLPKEVAIVSLQGHISGHWVISPLHTYDELSKEAKTTNDYFLRKYLEYIGSMAISAYVNYNTIFTILPETLLKSM